MVSFNNTDSLRFIEMVNKKNGLDDDNTTLSKKEIDAALKNTDEYSPIEVQQLKSLLKDNGLNGAANKNGDQFIGQYELAQYFNEKNEVGDITEAGNLTNGPFEGTTGTGSSEALPDGENSGNMDDTNPNQ